MRLPFFLRPYTQPLPLPILVEIQPFFPQLFSLFTPSTRRLNQDGTSAQPLPKVILEPNRTPQLTNPLPTGAKL